MTGEGEEGGEGGEGKNKMGPTTMSLKVTMNCVCNLNKTVEQTLKEF